MQLTMPTLPNLLAGIDQTMAPRVETRIVVGATRQCTWLLQDNQEQQLPLAKIIQITNSRHVGIWWSMNPPSELMDLLICCYPRSDTEDGSPSPSEIRFAPPGNWCPPQVPQMTGLPHHQKRSVHVICISEHPTSSRCVLRGYFFELM